MTWNWQQDDWPCFRFDAKALEPMERDFLLNAGTFYGAFKHLTLEDQETVRVSLICDEALKTSEIEGEILNRESLQSSLRKAFGFTFDPKRTLPAEEGMAKMRVDHYRRFNEPLTEKTLLSWHRMILEGLDDSLLCGRYRTHAEPMQIVSGPIHRRKVHFEAPPSNRVQREMENFITWFNDSRNTLKPLARSGMAHLYFVSIHPFEDGNGRIARALSEKVLSEHLGQPILISLSTWIQKNRKDYYQFLEKSHFSNELTDWLKYFARTLLKAQELTQKEIEFLIQKTQYFDRFRRHFNERQEKVIARMFREGVEGFKGGLSAKNYITLTKTSRATATRDLQELVTLGALIKSGELKGTRYQLNFV